MTGTLFVQLILDGLATGVVFVILACGMVLIASTCKILFMTYGMFYTLGAYFTWYVMRNVDLPYFPSLFIGLMLIGILTISSYFLIFRRLQHIERSFLATLIASMGLMMILNQSGMLAFGTVPRSIPPVFTGEINRFGVHIGVDRVVFIVLSLTVMLVLFWMYEKTKMGRAMRAVAFLPETAALYGINTDRIFLITFLIGCLLAAFAGGILAPTYGMTPEMGNNVLWTVMLLTMLGGIDSLTGAVAAGLIVGQMLSFGQFLIGSYIQIVTFVVIGFILYFRPGGLLGHGTEINV